MNKGRGVKKIKSGLELKKNRLCWAARIVTILYIIFISLFAFDVFEEGTGIWMTLFRFIIHLIPSIILAAVLFVAWRCERFGGALFLIVSIIFTLFFRTYKETLSFFLVSVPPLVSGIMFWFGAGKNKLDT